MLYNIAGPSSKSATPNLSVNLYNHIASLQASDAGMHSASQFEFGYNFLLEIFSIDYSII